MTEREGPRSPVVQPEAVSRELEAASKWRWVQDHWEALLPKLAAYWPRLPEEEVQELSGDRLSLVRLVKRHYALQQSGAEAQVDAWLAGLSIDSQSRARPAEGQRFEGEGVGSLLGAGRPRSR